MGTCWVIFMAVLCAVPVARVRTITRTRVIVKPIVQYKCDDCPTYFNVFSKTVFQGTHWKYSRVMMVLRGFLKGESTNSMSREMGWATATCSTCATS